MHFKKKYFEQIFLALDIQAIKCPKNAILAKALTWEKVDFFSWIVVKKRARNSKYVSERKSAYHVKYFQFGAPSWSKQEKRFVENFSTKFIFTFRFVSNIYNISCAQMSNHRFYSKFKLRVENGNSLILELVLHF